VKVMSIGCFVEENSAVVWRGPMLHKAIQQFLEDVAWGELEYLLLDLPPGTGDVSMTLAQLLPQAKFLIVTTPQPVAQKVARRAAEMAHKVDLEIGGVIENMASFITPSGERFALFGEGGGQAPAAAPRGRARRGTSPRPASRWSSATPTARPRRPSATPPAGSWRCSRSSCRSCRPRPPGRRARGPRGCRGRWRGGR